MNLHCIVLRCFDSTSDLQTVRVHIWFEDKAMMSMQCTNYIISQKLGKVAYQNFQHIKL